MVYRDIPSRRNGVSETIAKHAVPDTRLPWNLMLHDVAEARRGEGCLEGIFCAMMMNLGDSRAGRAAYRMSRGQAVNSDDVDGAYT